MKLLQIPILTSAKQKDEVKYLSFKTILKILVVAFLSLLLIRSGHYFWVVAVPILALSVNVIYLFIRAVKEIDYSIANINLSLEETIDELEN